MDPSMVNQNDRQKAYAFEVQTAPLSDGILPGVVRQLVIDPRYEPSLLTTADENKVESQLQIFNPCSWASTR
ncbi:hypothetical protein ACLOJK_001549, partial [Asimina triloba]